MKHNNYILLLLTLAALLTGRPAAAQDIVANGICYNIISDTQVEVAPAWDGVVNRYQGIIILPERVHCDGVNYEVAAIAPRAFWQSGVTEVQIPNSVTMIGDAAFADADQLTDITLPLGLTAVSRYMLAGTAVTSVVLPEGVTDIGQGAFEDCSLLRSVYLPASLRDIGEGAFAYCANLTDLYSDAALPPLTMGDDTFEGVNGLNVMVGDAATARSYRRDGVWGDDDFFTVWVDEGLAVAPSVEQEYLGENWTALALGRDLAYKIYGPDGYLKAVTAASHYYLPHSAVSADYLVVPTTLMYDEESLQLAATVAAPAAIEEMDDDRTDDLKILCLDGTIYIEGDTHGMMTFIYDVYGNLWYERPAVNNTVNLPGPRVYIVRVGDTVRKVFVK